jgi:hypothetical protein
MSATRLRQPGGLEWRWPQLIRNKSHPLAKAMRLTAVLINPVPPNEVAPSLDCHRIFKPVLDPEGFRTLRKLFRNSAGTDRVCQEQAGTQPERFEHPRHQNHAGFSVERKELFRTLACWWKSPSFAQCPVVAHADPNAAHALNTKLETNHVQQPLGPGCGG